MGLLKAFAAAAVLSALIPNSVALDVNLKTNVAVYYGQGAYQPRLSHFCQETSVDIINIGFINVFPKAVGDWPGSNFGNQCDGNVYEGTELLSGCHQIWEDIPVCKELGKTVMLSLGGETAYQDIASDEVAEWFADFLWYSFGPPGQNASFPRPFQDNQVDGFDFDIEHYGGYGYATMIQRLRSHFSNFPNETFYISGAPQCQIPDAQLSDAISQSDFDFIWVQWYNTQGCSAMDFVQGTGIFNFAQWAQIIENSANPDAKLFVGLPASEDAAGDGFYLTPAEVYPLVDVYMNLYPDMFGGIMLWEATAADNNIINGYDYTQHMKHILHKCDPSPPMTTSTIFVTPTSTPSTPSTSSISVVHTSSQTPSPISTPSSQPAPSSSTQIVSSIVSPSSSLASSTPSTVVPSSSPHSSSLKVPSSSVTSSPSASPSVTPGTTSGSSTSVSLSSHTAPSSTSVTPSSSLVVPSSSVASSPVASSSVTSGTTSDCFSSTPLSSHSVSSTTPVVSGKPSVKPTATPSEIPSSSGSPIPTHSGTSTGLVSHSSSSLPEKSTHTPGTIQPSVTRPVASPSESSPCSSPIGTIKPPTSGSLGSSTAGSSSSSASRGPSHTPTTRTPVSSAPSATSTRVSSSTEPSASTSASTTPSSAASSTDVSPTSNTVPTGQPSATGDETSTTDQPTGNGGESVTSSMVTTSPSVTPIPSTTKPPTVTTIIVTSYTDICPTGFTTITTTITTTVCPEATTGVTNAPSGPASTTPSIPEGWTTTIKVCNNCAPTPTTVTLTLPNPIKTTESAPVETSPVLVTTETWTTTVTFCKHCGVTGSSVTLTIPYTPAIATTTAVETSSASASQGDVTAPGGLPQTTMSPSQDVVVSSHGFSSSWSHGSGGVRPVSQTPTFKIHATTTSTVQNKAPTGSAKGASAEFNAAGSRFGLMNIFGISVATVLSICFFI